MPDKKPGRVENPAFDQGRKRIKEDRLHDAKTLQDRQHEVDIKEDKRKSITPTLSLIVIVLTFAFMVFTYYK